MRSKLCAFILILVAAGSIPMSAHAADSEIDPALVKVFDAAILRPLGFAGLAVGAVLFVPAVILSAPGGRDAVDEAREIFIDFPAENVFDRKLGDV